MTRTSAVSIKNAILKTLAFALFFGAVTFVTGNVMAGAATALALYTLVDWSNRNDVINPRVVLTLFYVVFILLGALLFEGLRGISYSQSALSSVYAGMISLCLGLLVGQALLPATKTSFASVVPASVYHTGVLNLQMILAFLAFALLVAMGGIPLLAEDPDAARLNFTAGKGHIAIFHKAGPVIALAMLFDALARDDRGRLRRAHWMAALVVFSLLLTGARGATGQVAMAYLIALMLVRGFRPSTTFILTVTAGGLLAMSIVGALRRFGALGVDNLLTEATVILTARAAAVQLIEIKASNVSPAGVAAYFYDLHKLLPGVSTGRNADIKELIFGNAANLHEQAGINPAIVGEAILNLGDSGPYFVPFIVALIASFCYAMALRKRRTFFWVAVYCFIISEIMIGIASGMAPRISGFVITFVWIVIISFYFNAPAKSFSKVPHARPVGP